MSKTLLEFYEDIIQSLGLHTTDDGYIYAGTPENKQLINENGKFLVIPTKKHIDTLYVHQDGKIEVSKVLYNPLREDTLKGNSVSFNKTKRFIETRLSHSLYIAGEMLLTLAHNPDLQKKSSFEINKFLSGLNAANNTGIKELVDEKSIANWATIYKKIVNSDNNMVTVFSKKRGQYDGVIYNRTTVLRCDLYTDLLEANNTTPVFDVKLRNKELTILKLMLEFLLPGIEEKPNTIVVGSNDPDAPAFTSLFTLYVRIANRLNKVIKDLKKVSEEMYDSGYIDIKVTEDEISTASIYKADVILIPDETDSNRKIKAEENKLSGGMVNTPTQPTAFVNPAAIPVVPQNQPLVPQHQTQMKAMDPVDRILYESGNYTPVAIRSEQPQIPMVTPNFNQGGGGYMVQPIQRPPLRGINAIPLPSQQPMGYNQQPMMNVGQYQPIGQPAQLYAQGQLPNPVMGNYNNPYQPQVPYYGNGIGRVY